MRTSMWKLAIVGAACACEASSQTSRGTVTGTVLDPSGASIVQARVTLTGVETGVRRSTEANESGIYRFDAVDPGVYNLDVTQAGFRPFLASGIGVGANRVTTFDPKLEVGAAEYFAGPESRHRRGPRIGSVCHGGVAAPRDRRRAAVADAARPPSLRRSPFFVSFRVRLSSGHAQRC